MSTGRILSGAEFNEFWKSLSTDLKEVFKANAAEMGFTA